MHLSELIEKLEEQHEAYGDVEVRFMTQQSWPFENSIRGVCSSEELNEAEYEPDEEDEDENENIVYLVEGKQLCYGNAAAWDVIS